MFFVCIVLRLLKKNLMSPLLTIQLESQICIPCGLKFASQIMGLRKAYLFESFQRVVSANRADELRRAERRKALEEESREALSALRAKCEQKQKRAELRLSTIALDKEHSLKGQR